MPEHNLTVDEAKAMIEGLDMPQSEKDELLNDIAMSNALQAAILALAEKVKNGEAVTWTDVSRETSRVSEEYGVESGIPMPHIEEDNHCPLVLARHAPLAWLNESRFLTTEHAQELYRLGKAVINSWDTPEWSVTIYATDEGPKVVKRPHAGGRLRKSIRSLGLRHDIGMTAEAELTAMELLKSKIKPHQYTQYVLNGMFLERSDKSDLLYLFRKGLPTLVISGHGKDNSNGCKVIAALCMHPMGYYSFTYVGVMTPTDEVIAALLMMRGDEHKFWKESGQWSAVDPRSGI